MERITTGRLGPISIVRYGAYNDREVGSYIYRKVWSV